MSRPILKKDRTTQQPITRSQPSTDRQPVIDKSPQFFHNPYNFVPALPRDKVTNELGDRLPSGHDRYLPGNWSGSIRVKLTTKTPLLIPDAFQANEDGKGHKTFSLRMLNGKPYLPPTSIKGMLRSAYEGVTNSRLSVFSEHDKPLVYRMPAANVFVYPAVVRKSADGRTILRIMPGYGVMGSAGKLPYYEKDSTETDKGEINAALQYHHESEYLPSHKDRVWVRFNSSNDANDLPEDVKPYFSGKLMKNVVTRIYKRDHESPPDRNSTWHKGIVCISGANIKEKRYERVFIEDDENDKKLVIEDRLDRLWADIVLDYKNVKLNQRYLDKRKAENHYPDEYLGHEPGKTAFSRHIYEPGSEKLTPGTLCYVELDTKLQRGEDRKITSKNIKAILPVIVSRHFYDADPQSLLDRSLQPATKDEELSPADRVFGWVNQAGKGAYRGNLRIFDVCCITSNPVEKFESGLPLAILGQPQPQQGRFYAAKDDQGTPFKKEIGKQELYQPGSGLRGRKVYPHHQSLPENYWKEPSEDCQHTDPYQEYRRPKDKEGIEQQDNQNRSITEWVKPEVTFEFSIEITNLSSVELGALLWLLTLPENHYHRLGGGKPFGFGSVTLAVDWEKTDLLTGKDLQTYYGSLLTPPTPADFDLSIPISAFKQAVTAAYRNDFSEVSFIKAFCQAAHGFDDGKPIHYPRVTPNPTPDGESFKWFTANEKNEKNKEKKPSRQYPLDSLIGDRGLPRWQD